MANCKKVTRLLSDALDRPLTPGEWLTIRTHLPMCSGCRNYRKQIALLREATKLIRDGEAPAAADEAAG
ncbi:zf-HC2 domain-containing protein [Andreprevotia chitinilytica]|uniref:zf-HC2 domain-containing protein n=1 Tax=Andreprevotia chitinilytica TaxID=396808 RepID=UPI000551CB0C|nr:zf-HC2 domain-containing protein [Andreprevotia chitinilytica]